LPPGLLTGRGPTGTTSARVPLHPQTRQLAQQVEIEIGVLRSQCLDRRIADSQTLASEIAAWQQQRTASGARIQWMFDAERARQKMGRLYPSTITTVYLAA